MEVSIIKDSSLKIKGNKTTIVTDPISKSQGEIVLITKDSEEIDKEKVEGCRLAIAGPGEYEVGGISVVVKNAGKAVETEEEKNLVFSIVVDSNKALLLNSSAIGKNENDECDLVIIRVNSKVSDDVFSSFNTKYLVLYGDLENLNLKTEDVIKVSKVSLRKNNELEGKIILLSA